MGESAVARFPKEVVAKLFETLAGLAAEGVHIQPRQGIELVITFLQSSQARRFLKSDLEPAHLSLLADRFREFAIHDFSRKP